jgi:AraC-like DNA-binding protein
VTHQINIFLLLFGALQGWLLSFWFLKNQNNKLANTYFAFFLITIGLQLTFKVITKIWLMEHVLFPYLLTYKFPYLIGPLLFLYVKARRDNTFHLRDLLHFIPFGGAAILTYLTGIQRMDIPGIHPYSQAAVQLLSLSIYGYASLRLQNINLQRFIAIAFLAEMIITVTLAFMYMYYGKFPDVRLLFITLTVLVYWISYKAISQPDLFLEKDATPMVSMELQKTTKYSHSSLKPAEASRIENDLHILLQQEKFYLDSSLTIDGLSVKLKTSRHHLSQVLNEKLNKSYLDFISDLRLEEARRRLSAPANFRYTIASIALDSGFSSVSNFNEIFKKRYNITPSKFRDQQLNKKMSA